MIYGANLFLMENNGKFLFSLQRGQKNYLLLWKIILGPLGNFIFHCNSAKQFYFFGKVSQGQKFLRWTSSSCPLHWKVVCSLYLGGISLLALCEELLTEALLLAVAPYCKEMCKKINKRRARNKFSSFETISFMERICIFSKPLVWLGMTWMASLHQSILSWIGIFKPNPRLKEAGKVSKNVSF